MNHRKAMPKNTTGPNISTFEIRGNHTVDIWAQADSQNQTAAASDIVSVEFIPRRYNGLYVFKTASNQFVQLDSGRDGKKVAFKFLGISEKVEGL